MKTTMVAAVLIVIVGVGVGYYMGWFRMSSSNDDGKPKVSVSVDTDKINTDKNKVVDKVQDLRQEAADVIAPTTQKEQ